MSFHTLGDSCVDTLSSGPDENQVARAKVLTEDLLEVVRSEHAKAQAAMMQQQMELHAAQLQFSQYPMVRLSYLLLPIIL